MRKIKVPAFFKAHAAEFLAGSAIIGLVGTVISTVLATKSAVKAIEEQESESGEPLTTAEKVKTCAVYYIPPILTGLATTACIVGTIAENKKAIASISGSYAMIADQYRRYRTATRNVFGEDGHQAVLKEMETVPKADVYISAQSLSGDFDLPRNSKKYLFYDSISDIPFESTYEDVLTALYHLNRNFSGRGYVELNEYYKFLGIDCDSRLGWSVTDFDIPSLDIGIYKGEKNGKECYILVPLFEPTADFMREWL